jgi:hypothetical protein
MLLRPPPVVFEGAYANGKKGVSLGQRRIHSERLLLGFDRRRHYLRDRPEADIRLHRVIHPQKTVCEGELRIKLDRSLQELPVLSQLFPASIL